MTCPSVGAELDIRLDSLTNNEGQNAGGRADLQYSDASALAKKTKVPATSLG